MAETVTAEPKPEQAPTPGEPEKGKKKFKMPNTYVILFGVICLIAVLTWFVPGGAYDLTEGGDAIAGTYHTVASNPRVCGTCSWRPSPACWGRGLSAAPFPSRLPFCCSAAFWK